MTQQPVPRAVSHELVLVCLDRAGQPLDLGASLDYSPSDPYAVWLTFHAPSGDVTWAMSRSLLSCALTRPAGEGDVRMWPSIDESARAVVVMEFRSPDGRLVAQAPTQKVHHFLTHTLALVPLGTESDYVDVDELIESILGGSQTQ